MPLPRSRRSSRLRCAIAIWRPRGGCFSMPSDAIGALSASLNGDFSRAIDTILSVERAGSSSAAWASPAMIGAQDRRHAGLDRHAGPFRPSRRGEPWRSRHGHARRCAADAVQLRRDGGAFRSDHLCQAVLHSADRHREQFRVPACCRRPMWRCCCRRRRRPARWAWRPPPRRP